MGSDLVLQAIHIFYRAGGGARSTPICAEGGGGSYFGKFNFAGVERVMSESSSDA